MTVHVCDDCERCTWNPGDDCGRAEHPHCPTCGHCAYRHTSEEVNPPTAVQEEAQ